MTERVLPGIGLNGFWDQGAPWKVGGDQNWLKSSVLTQLAVESMTTPLPVSPSNGVIYIVPAEGIPANQIAARDNGTWVYFPPFKGLTAYVRDANGGAGALMTFDGAAWVPSTTPLASPAGAAQIGTSDGGNVQAAMDARATFVNLGSVWAKMSPALRADALSANPVLDHSPAFQAAVNEAVASGVNQIFIPFAQGQKYRFGSTITILSGDFAIRGDHAPIRGASVALTANAGYIFGIAGVDALFDFGGSTNINFAGAFICDGVAFYGRTNIATGDYTSQPRAIKLTQLNNGPTRHVLFRNTTANNFYDAFWFDNPDGQPASLAAATVTFDGCYTRNNFRSAVYANKRILGLHYVNMLSESGGSVMGQISGGTGFAYSMMEGNFNNVDIWGPGPTNAEVEGVYHEAMSGEFAYRIKPANIGSSVVLGENFFGGSPALENLDDFMIVGGGATARETRTSAITKWSLLTLDAAWQGSELKGKFFYRLELGAGARVWTDPRPHIGKKPANALQVSNAGFDTFDTPFGKTASGLVLTGTTPVVGPSWAQTYAAGDVLSVMALIQADEGALPRITVYDQAGVNVDAAGGSMTTSGVPIDQEHGNEWQLWSFTIVAARAGAGLRLGFAAGVAAKNIRIAGYGFQVIPAAEWVTTKYSSKSRAKLQLWTPYNFAQPVLNTSVTYNWPSLATGAQQSTTVTLQGSAMGDFAVASMSTPLQGTQLWAEVTAVDTVTVYQVNNTGGAVDLPSASLRVRVSKQGS